MTDNLTTKFNSFEGLVTANHTALMDLLNSIAETIGAPPTGPTTTLADVVTALTQTNTILAGIRSDMADQSAALLSVTNSLYTNSELMIQNSSTNTQALLAALYTTFCGCTTDAPPLAPPLDVTPTPLEPDAKCQRIQLYLAVFTTWLQNIANYGASGATISGDVLGALLVSAGTAFGMATSGAEAGTIFGIPGAVVGAVLGAIVGAAYAFGGSYLVAQANTFSSPIVQNALLNALYAVDTADEGQAAFEAATLPFFDTIPNAIINFLWWTGWSNDMYSDTPVVDASAFDGSICAPPPITDCISWTTEQMQTESTSNGDRIRPILSVHDIVGHAIGDGTNSAMYGDWSNWTYTVTGVGIQAYAWENDTDFVTMQETSASVPGTFTGTIPASVGDFRILFQSYVEAFTLELCPPE